MAQIKPTVNEAHEIAEISRDFAKPIEVLREAIHNSYDSGATEMHIKAFSDEADDATRQLTISFSDNGTGMNEDELTKLFGLGHSTKDSKRTDRQSIGYKGHGTKIFYQAASVCIATKTEDGELLLAYLDDARKKINKEELPMPTLLKNQEAQIYAVKNEIEIPSKKGTSVKLIDFTPNSERLIETSFKRAQIETYLRWFTIFGSFRKVVETNYEQPMKLFLQATDEQSPKEVHFGHNWPAVNNTDMTELKQKDRRRPFNYFQKTITKKVTGTNFQLEIVALFEGKRARRERDTAMRRQGKKDGLYHEEERYGLWLCKDYFPIEAKFEWLSETECPISNVFHKPLIFVNCQKFALTANRGSVGNSADSLLSATKEALFRFLEESRDSDTDIGNFLNEYDEDMYSRIREKDRKFLQRRVERYNKKKWCKIKLPNGQPYEFFEPTREATLFSLVHELQRLAPEILELDILDYDDHIGIDLLVRKKSQSNPSDLLEKSQIQYTELKFELESAINHPFDNLQAIVCWETELSDKSTVIDATNETFIYEEVLDDKITYSQLKPQANNQRLSHNIRVIALKRLLKQKFEYVESDNPKPVQTAPMATTGTVRKKR